MVSTAISVNAADCEQATIKMVGVNPANTTTGASDYFVRMDCANDATWPGIISFYLSSDLGDSGLATLLTATSLNLPVWVRTSGIAPGSLVTVIYMNTNN